MSCNPNVESSFYKEATHRVRNNTFRGKSSSDCPPIQRAATSLTEYEQPKITYEKGVFNQSKPKVKFSVPIIKCVEPKVTWRKTIVKCHKPIVTQKDEPQISMKPPTFEYKAPNVKTADPLVRTNCITFKINGQAVQLSQSESNKDFWEPRKADACLKPTIVESKKSDASCECD